MYQKKLLGLLEERVAYVFTDIPVFDSHSPNFFIKNGLKLLKEKSLKARKFFIRRNNNKVNSIETEHIVIADLLPRSDLEK